MIVASARLRQMTCPDAAPEAWVDALYGPSEGPVGGVRGRGDRTIVGIGVFIAIRSTAA